MDLTDYYAIAKLVAYSAWCGVGVYYLRSYKSAFSLLFTALGYGVLRLVLGFLLGALLMGYPLGALSGGPFSNMPLYFLLLTPVRIVEWSIMFAIISKNESLKKAIPWVAVGVIISFLVDIIFIPEGLGRLFC
jgi:hypothetical protein